MSKKSYVCIVCPRSCHLEVEQKEDGEIKVTNFQCKRGLEYGKNEFLNPMRMLSSTISIEGAKFRRLPVISKGEIPKEKLFGCLQSLYKVKVKSPIKEGDVVLANICGTGVDIIASINM